MADEILADAAQGSTAPAPEQQQQQQQQPAPVQSDADSVVDPLDSLMAEDADKASPAPEKGIGENGLMGGGDEPAAGSEKPEGADRAESGGESDSDGPRYEPFTLPDGFVEDKDAMEQVRSLAKEHGLKQDQAQKWVDAYTALEQRRAADSVKAIAENDKTWLKEIQEHSEFGGANLPANAEKVGALIRRFGSPKLAAEMRQMNIQNWPEMYYCFARISQAMSEDASPGGAKGTREITVDDFYKTP